MPIEFPDQFVHDPAYLAAYLGRGRRLSVLGQTRRGRADHIERAHENRRCHLADHLLTCPESAAWQDLDTAVAAAIAAVNPNPSRGDDGARYDIARSLWADSGNPECHKSAETMFDRFTRQVDAALRDSERLGAYAVLTVKDDNPRRPTTSGLRNDAEWKKKLRFFAVGSSGLFVVGVPASRDVRSAYLPRYSMGYFEAPSNRTRRRSNPLPRERLAAGRVGMRWRDGLPHRAVPAHVERFRAYRDALTRLRQKVTAASRFKASLEREEKDVKEFVIDLGRLDPFRVGAHDYARILEPDRSPRVADAEQGREPGPAASGRSPDSTPGPETCR